MKDFTFSARNLNTTTTVYNIKTLKIDEFHFDKLIKINYEDANTICLHLNLDFSQPFCRKCRPDKMTRPLLPKKDGTCIGAV